MSSTNLHNTLYRILPLQLRRRYLRSLVRSLLARLPAVRSSLACLAGFCFFPMGPWVAASRGPMGKKMHARNLPIDFTLLVIIVLAELPPRREHSRLLVEVLPFSNTSVFRKLRNGNQRKSNFWTRWLAKASVHFGQLLMLPPFAGELRSLHSLQLATNQPLSPNLNPPT